MADGLYLCPKCGTVVRRTLPARPDDLLVCPDCEAVSRFDDGLLPVLVPEEELDALPAGALAGLRDFARIMRAGRRGLGE